MPGPLIHLRIAKACLDRWDDSPMGDLPFDTRAASARQAFCFGTLAPDFGYAPGAVRLLSDLAHYVSSGHLVRSLWAEAQAVACGWASHVLADVAIHPIVNRAAGELLDRSPMAYADDPIAHFVVEQHLEHRAAVAHHVGRELEGAKGVPAGHVTVLHRAYESCYSRRFEVRDFARTARSGLMALRAMAATTRSFGRLLELRQRRPGPRTNRIYSPARAALMALRRPTRLAELTAWSSLAPLPWQEVRQAMDQVVEQTLEGASETFRSLADYNLDLGVVERDPLDYVFARRAVAALEARPRT